MSWLIRLRRSGPGLALVLWVCVAGPHLEGQTVPPREIHGSTSGTVLEAMDAVGYTYVLVDTGSEQVWFAAPGFRVAVGDAVVAPAGALMRDHYSKTLDRTFETIYFVGGIRVAGGEGDASKAPVHRFQHSGTGGTGDAGLDLDFRGIARVDGGMTVGEIFDAGSELAGREVAVRGRVTRFSPHILDTNFLHLSDGTSSSDGRDDLTVTTKTEVEVGSLVVVRGLVRTDKDFGLGYAYDVLIEDASITAE